MRYIVSALMLALLAGTSSAQVTLTTHREWRPTPDGGHPVVFYDPNNLNQTKRWFAKELNAKALPAPPSTWDFGVSVGGGKIDYPMDLNDQYGDCFYAERCHADNTFTGWYGPQSVFSLSAIKTRYLALSGGDNGLSDGDVQREHRDRYIADLPAAKAIDFLYVDVTNPAAIDAALYWFGGSAFTFTVAQAWINNSSAEFVWEASTYRSNSNGHAVHWNGKNSRGYRLVTWAVTGTITPEAVKVCNPDGFVTFSVRMFDPKTGYAMNKKHITELAAMWASAGGKAIPASVIAQFPPIAPPAPGPPVPVPPTPTPPIAGRSITLKGWGSAADGTYQIVPAGSRVVDPVQLQKLHDMLDKLLNAPATPAPTKPPSPILPPRTAGLEDVAKALEDLEHRLGNRMDRTEKRVAGLGKPPAPKAALKHPADFPLNPDAGRIVVTVPADAVVTVGGQPTKSTGPVRGFDTPKLLPLRAGEDYVYRVDATWRGGQASRLVTVRPGQVTTVQLAGSP